MKKTFSIVMILVIACLMFVGLAGCGSSASKGLEFESNGDGTCVWTGIGSCSDTEIVVPTKNGEEMVVAVGTAVLDRNAGVTKITLPDSVKEIKKEAFAHNNDLAEINFGAGLEVIGDNAFYFCEKIEKVEFPSTLKSIGIAAFGECKLIEEIIIPEGVTELGPNAFDSVESKLKKVALPSTLKVLKSSDFNFDALEEIEVKHTYKYCHLSKSTNDAGEKKLDLYGSFDDESESGVEVEVTEENLPALICIITGKTGLKVNGKDASVPTELALGEYESDGNSRNYKFEIAEENAISLIYESMGERDVIKGKYELNEGTKEIAVNIEENLQGERIVFNGTVICIGDCFIMDGDLEIPALGQGKNIYGLWTKK